MAEKPEGYFYAISDDGSLCVSENDPGLGACRIHWKPYGNFDGDREVNIRVSMDVWEKIVAQKHHEAEKKKAKAALKPKEVKNGEHELPAQEGGAPGF